MKESMIIYRSFVEAIKCLPEGEREPLLMAVLEYGIDGTEPELDGAYSAMFTLMKPQIDANNKRYENGKKGGRPAAHEKPNDNQAETETKPSDNQNETKPEPNVNDNVNVNVNANDNVKEKESAKEKGAAAPTRSSDKKTERHKYGTYGWVRLSDREYTRLISDYGEKTVADAIRYIDESAQQTGNKNKWKDWNVTLRKAITNNWGGISPSKNKVLWEGVKRLE